jgi:aldehyde dehydrogenase (NAD+)
MQDEVFGPILPIVNINSVVDAIKYINGRNSVPLCMYVFSASKEVQTLFENHVKAGTLACNETIVQFAIDELPFGGAGESGMGTYHGKYSFEAFSRDRACVYRDFSYLADKLGVFRYPPYSELKINFLCFLLHHWKKFNITYFDYIPHLICFFMGIFAVLLFNYTHGGN